MWLNQMVHSLVSIYFESPQIGHTIKASCINIQTVDPEIGSILIFSRRVLDQFPNHIFKKNFSYVIFYNLTKFIVSLLLFLDILGYICVLEICFLVCDVINFEVNHIFLFKLFFCITKIVRTKFKNFKNEKSFDGDIKNIFHYL